MNVKYSESRSNLMRAIAEVQIEVGVIEKTGRGSHGRHIKLDVLLNNLRPFIYSNGLTMIQVPIGDGERFGIHTSVTHNESGEYLEAEALLSLTEWAQLLTKLPLQVDSALYAALEKLHPNDWQRALQALKVTPNSVEAIKKALYALNTLHESGKITTYLKRYAAASIFLIVSEEDTDGEQRSGSAGGKEPQRKTRSTSPTKRKEAEAEKKRDKNPNARPWSPDRVKRHLLAGALTHQNIESKLANPKDAQRTAALLTKAAGSPELRYAFTKAIFDTEKLNEHQKVALLDYVDPGPNHIAGWSTPDPLAVQEIQAVLKQLKEGEDVS